MITGLTDEQMGPIMDVLMPKPVRNPVARDPNLGAGVPLAKQIRGVQRDLQDSMRNSAAQRFIRSTQSSGQGAVRKNSSQI